MIGNEIVSSVRSEQRSQYFNQLSYPDSHYLKINNSFISAG
jgi:hypothetical protein